MEGIMMRGPHRTVMAVRRADGSIKLEEVAQKEPTIWNKIPIIRGITSFIQSMTTGTKTLMRSAEFVMEDEQKKLEEEEKQALAQSEASLLTENSAVSESSAEDCVEKIEPASETRKERKARIKSEKQAEKQRKAKEKERRKINKKVAKIESKYDPKIEKLKTDFEAKEAAISAKCEKKLNVKSEKKKAKLSAKFEKATEKRLNAYKKDKEALIDKKEDLIAIAKGEKEDDRLFMQILMIFSTVLGFGLAILLFFFLPTWIYEGIIYLLGLAGADGVIAFLGKNIIWQSIFEGVMKIFIFVIYVLLARRMEEIQRLFSYHGAEHKCIFCYEAGEELTPENAKKFKRFHPRCGTSFLIIMMVLGIIVGMFVPKGMYFRPLIKLALIPLIMGVGYELLKMCGRHDNFLTRIISAPGMWMQHLTTVEPDESQLECAIAALKEVIPENSEDDQW